MFYIEPQMLLFAIDVKADLTMHVPLNVPEIDLCMYLQLTLLVFRKNKNTFKWLVLKCCLDRNSLQIGCSKVVAERQLRWMFGGVFLEMLAVNKVCVAVLFSPRARVIVVMYCRKVRWDFTHVPLVCLLHRINITAHSSLRSSFSFIYLPAFVNETSGGDTPMGITLALSVESEEPRSSSDSTS